MIEKEIRDIPKNKGNKKPHIIPLFNGDLIIVEECNGTYKASYAAINFMEKWKRLDLRFTILIMLLALACVLFRILADGSFKYVIAIIIYGFMCYRYHEILKEIHKARIKKRADKICQRIEDGINNIEQRFLPKKI